MMSKMFLGLPFDWFIHSVDDIIKHSKQEHKELPITVLFVSIDGKADVILLTTTYNHT